MLQGIKEPITATPPKVRVQRFRARLRERHCRRLEVWIEGRVVDDLRMLASYRRVPLRQLVREAFHATVTAYGGVLDAIKKFQSGRVS